MKTVRPGKGPSKNAARDNVVPLKRPTPGRLPLEGAVVRVVIPTAAELSPRARATGIDLGVDLDKLAHMAAANRQNTWRARNAGETDAAHALRARHFVALQFAKNLVLELEALRPTAEGADGASDRDVAELRAHVACVEAARNHYLGDARDKVRRIGAVRAALEHARRWTEHYTRSETSIDVDPDQIQIQACRTAPELECISPANWKSAIAAWPGEVRRKRGRKRGPGPPGGKLSRHEWTWEVVAARAATGGDWAEVVFTLFAPYAGLTDTKSPGNLAETWGRDRAADITRSR